ncbi:MAG: UvrD-helicase domain-containing protein [Acidimicrobiia bacterium]|nr:UvrD-helicase domain-containing protein [Acidimicrobiia bacterium]MCY4432916.1 UvrD-helicase domain-containing protein [bacterium]
MRILQDVSPTDEQLTIIGEVRPGFRIIRGAAGSGKTTTALLCLGQLVAARLSRRQRFGHQGPVRVLVLTFNRTLQGYIAELARRSTPNDDALELTISTFARWARTIVGDADIAGRDQESAMIRPLLKSFVTSQQQDFFADEVAYILGRFTPQNRSEYLTVLRQGRGVAPRVDRPVREKLLEDVLPAYEEIKDKRGLIDWSDLAVLAADAQPDLRYDVVIVDETQDFSANQVRAVTRHLQDPHTTTFIIDAIQRIYPQYFTWREVGITARPEIIHTLKENYRNTEAIAAFALPLVDGLPMEDDGTLPDFTACSRSGIKPLIIAGKYSQQLQTMLDRLASITDFRTESIALLQPRGGGWFNEARNTLRARGIAYCELARENEWPSGPEVVALCTIHSAKGLEFDHVLLPGLSQQVTPHGPQDGDADLERLRRMLAMAIGRSRKSVMIGYKPGEESSLVGLLDPSTYELVEV